MFRTIPSLFGICCCDVCVHLSFQQCRSREANQWTPLLPFNSATPSRTIYTGLAALFFIVSQRNPLDCRSRWQVQTCSTSFSMRCPVAGQEDPSYPRLLARVIRSDLRCSCAVSTCRTLQQTRFVGCSNSLFNASPCLWCFVIQRFDTRILFFILQKFWFWWQAQHSPRDTLLVSLHGFLYISFFGHRSNLRNCS